MKINRRLLSIILTTAACMVLSLGNGCSSVTEPINSATIEPTQAVTPPVESIGPTPHAFPPSEGNPIDPKIGMITAYTLDPEKLTDGNPCETLMRIHETHIMHVIAPFLSAWPGLGFIFTFEDCEIKLSVDQGHLFDTVENTMQIRGAQYHTPSGNLVFWSPRDAESESILDDMAAHANINFTVYQDDQEIASGRITINQLNENDPFFSEHPIFTDSSDFGWFYNVELVEFSTGE